VALTSEETFGTVVPGFVTNLDGDLSVTTDDTGAGYGIVPGFLTDPDGRLVVTETTTDAEFDGGFARSPDGALIIAQSGTPVYGVIPGFGTTAEGYLITGTASSPTWREGFLRNANSALAVEVTI
jgi:hypothetical protein